MRVVCISDTHGLHADLHAAARIPDGDVLIHAGDFTDTGDRDEVLAFNKFLATLPHKYKLVIAGNHESTFDRDFYPHNWQHYGHGQQYNPMEVRALLTNALYLEDQAVLINGFLFYGSPWQPEFCNWAFNLPRGDKLVAKWRQIPSQVDVLVTHTPPLGRGDQVGHLRVGCADLLHEVQTRIKPPYHVFGHVHEGYGSSSDGVTTFLNASSCTHEYEAINPAFVIDLKAPRCAHAMGDGAVFPRYEVLLHEQLRVCSQKPAFVPAPHAAAVRPVNGQIHPQGLCHHDVPHDGVAASRKTSLREFRVDGTTQALLFESTLKLRPVRAQTRALRYLFHRGFHSTAPGGEMEEGEASNEATGQAYSAMTTTADGNGETRAALRRRVSLARRATMGVIEDIPDATREAVVNTSIIGIESTDESKAPASSESATTGSANPRRARRIKTLTKRDAVAKLATMIEEPDEQVASLSTTATVVQEKVPSPLSPSTTQDSSSTKMSVPMPADDKPGQSQAPPPAVAPECILCNYKVAGHVHPTSDRAPPSDTNQAATTATEQPAKPAAPPQSDCTLCKYKVPGHVHPGAAPASVDIRDEIASTSSTVTGSSVATEEAETSTRSSGRTLADRNSRLSSWF